MKVSDFVTKINEYEISDNIKQKVRSLKVPEETEIFLTLRDTAQIELEKDGNYIEIEMYDDHNNLYIEYSDGCEVDREIDDWEIERVLKIGETK